MAEELVFARKASGLVRGLNGTDTFGMGLMFIQPIYAVWYVVMVGLGIFHGGNLIIALTLSLIVCGVVGPFIWGVLGGTMPRSGGDYVFNSRIISAPIALAASIVGALGGVYWTLFEATWITSPSLTMLAGYMGWPWLQTFATTRWAVLLLGLLSLVAGFAIIAFGMSLFKKVQKPLMMVGIGGPVVLAVILLVTSRGHFIENWNRLAAQYHSLTYNQFIGAVGQAAGPMPTTWNWHDTFGLMSTMATFFLYTYIIAFVSGEVKRPDKTLLVAGWLSAIVVFLIGAASFWGLYHAVGTQFLSAAAVNSLWGGVKGYNLPFDSSYMSLAYVASGGNAVIAWVAALTFLLTTQWLITITFLLPARSFFAWGMDRMGPKWFTSVSARYASPVWNCFLFLVLCAVGLVVYELWAVNAFAGLISAGMQLGSLFLLVGISAILIPFRKRTENIWAASPYRTWKFAGMPTITLAGIIYVVYILMLLYFAFLAPQTRDITGKNLALIGGAWAFGLLYYVFWWNRNRKAGIDVGLAYGQLPPE